MENWKNSVHSDGSRYFLSPQHPEYGDRINVRLQIDPKAPIERIYLRTNPNGAHQLSEMRKTGTRNGLDLYEADFELIEPVMNYHFYLKGKDKIYYYDQKGLSTVMPDQQSDFKVLAKYHQPEWIKDAVFYQIFPERFNNGDPSLDVKDGQIHMDGHSSIHREWNEKPLEYEEGFCMDFFGGDLKGIEDKIGYLKRLGVNAIYLNPIFQAPSTHKYDCVDYLKVDDHFGGDEALASLSKALHENGMHLILDISINHTGMNHKWFNKEGEFFDKSIGAYNNPDAKERAFYYFHDNNEYEGWLGVKTLPALNYTSEPLKRQIYLDEDSVLKKWLNPPYSIDGWRFDVADVFARHNQDQLDQIIWPEITEQIRKVSPDAYILAEDWGACSEHLQGDQWDSAMNYFGSGRILREFAGLPDHFNERTPGLADFSPDISASELKERVIQHLSKIPFVIWQNQFNLIDSHDISRLHHHPVPLDLQRGLVLLQFMLPGVPSIYYGDEAEIDGWTGNNEGCRFPMPWQKNFEKSETFRFYQDLAHLRKSENVLKEGSMKFLKEHNKALALARFDDQKALVALVNGSDHEEIMEIDFGLIGAMIPKRSTDHFGRQFEIEKLDEHRARITLPAYGYLLIETPLRDAN